MTPEDIDLVEPDLDGAGLRIGIVQARFNPLHTKALLHACVAELDRLGVASPDITCASVPGALEAPLALRAMAESGEFDALIAIGAVVRGETYHFEVVSNESARGVAEVALATGVPIANAILTCDTDAQAAARVHDKGTDAARVAVEMANLLLELAPESEDEVTGDD